MRYAERGNSSWRRRPRLGGHRRRNSFHPALCRGSAPATRAPSYQRTSAPRHRTRRRWRRSTSRRAGDRCKRDGDDLHRVDDGTQPTLSMSVLNGAARRGCVRLRGLPTSGRIDGIRPRYQDPAAAEERDADARISRIRSTPATPAAEAWEFLRAVAARPSPHGHPVALVRVLDRDEDGAQCGVESSA
jgi:hypothetical protein